MSSSRRTFLGITAAVLAIAAASARGQAPKISSRKAEHDVAVSRNVMIPMRDGVRLAADIYRPAKAGRPLEKRLPTLLTRTPYNKGDGRSSEAEYFAARGYNVVLNDVRGRYASEGAWRMMADDPNDGYDTVEWIAAQSWSNGQVGTFGTSYPGGTQHALAEADPPHLSTMIPVDALSNCGIAGMRHGGAFELRFMNWIFNLGAPTSKAALADPALRLALSENGRRIREHVDSLPLRRGDNPLKVVPEYENWLIEAMSSGPESPFWKIKGMSVVDHTSEYKSIPVLHITGWYDSWTRQVALNYEVLSRTKKAPQRLIIGPWVHGGQRSNFAGEVEFGADAAVDLDALRLAWYDRYMRVGQEDGEGVAVEGENDRDPPVLIYVMGTGDDRKTASGKLRHGGYWRSEREWPLARAKSIPYYFHRDMSISNKAPTESDSRTTYSFDPKHPVPTIGGNISSNVHLMTNGGYDQRPREDTHAAENRLPLSERGDILVFRTPPLEEDTETTGNVVVRLWVASDAPDTDFTAKLIDEIPPNPDYPLGFDLNIGDSIVRARYREILEREPADRGDNPRQVPAVRFLEPGRVEPIAIRLYPTSHVFKKGHRIRIDISSSNYPRFDVNPNTGEPLGRDRRKHIALNTVFHDAAHPSHAILPIVSRPVRSR